MRGMRGKTLFLGVTIIALVAGTYYGVRQVQHSFHRLPSFSATDSAVEQTEGIPTSVEKEKRKLIQQKTVQTKKFHSIEITSIPLVIQTSSGGNCGVIEYLGHGPDAQVTRAQWKTVIDLFHQAKLNLAQWLQKMPVSVPAEKLKVLSATIKDLHIQRPPTAEEPDLVWRGLVVLGRDSQGAPVVRVGSGFIDLAMKDSNRALFELTRSIAQTLSPCEQQTQTEFLSALGEVQKCFQLPAVAHCVAGQPSEEGWAISTYIAAQVSHPGCKIPALVDAQACLNQLGVSKVAQGDIRIIEQAIASQAFLTKDLNAGASRSIATDSQIKKEGANK